MLFSSAPANAVVFGMQSMHPCTIAMTFPGNRHGRRLHRHVRCGLSQASLLRRMNLPVGSPEKYKETVAYYLSCVKGTLMQNT